MRTLSCSVFITSLDLGLDMAEEKTKYNRHLCFPF